MSDIPQIKQRTLVDNIKDCVDSYGFVVGIPLTPEQKTELENAGYLVFTCTHTVCKDASKVAELVQAMLTDIEDIDTAPGWEDRLDFTPKA